MCIDFDGHHSGGSSFVYVNDFCYYRNCLYTHWYKFSSDKEQINESQYIVSCPGLDSDLPIGSNRDPSMTGGVPGAEGVQNGVSSYVNEGEIKKKMKRGRGQAKRSQEEKRERRKERKNEEKEKYERFSRSGWEWSPSF